MFNKLKELWNPIPDRNSDNRQNNDEKIRENRPSASLVAPVGSSVELRKELLDKIVKNEFFRPFWDSKEITDTFVLWVTADKPAYQIEVGKKDFPGALHKEFDNAELSAVGAASWLIETKAPAEGAKFVEIEPGLYLEIRNPAARLKSSEKIPTKAKISIAGGSGVLVRDEYLLDADNRQAYQIGRGEKDKAGRKNHIALCDNAENLMHNNKYVSGAHARILFVANKGFCLKSLNAGNRTIVYRDDSRAADLRDLHSVFGPLQTGDLIELGKKVLLKFEVVDNA